MFDTLRLTARQRAALDAELVERVAGHGRPVTLAELFGGMRPTWAVDAAGQLVLAGKLRETDGGRLVVAGGRT